MRVGFTSQNFRTITGHAGRTRRFLIFDLAQDGTATEMDRLDLPEEMTIHAYHVDGPHPLDSLDLLVTKECGDDFRRRLARRGVTVVISAEDTDPVSVLRAIAEGRLDLTPPAISADDLHQHHHHDHDHGHDHAEGECGCGSHDHAGDADHACCRETDGNAGSHDCGCQDGTDHKPAQTHEHAAGHGGQGRCCGGGGRGRRRMAVTG